MVLKSYLEGSFPEGLSYNNAVQLCLRLYCSVEGLPESLHVQCTKDNLASVFAEMAREKFIIGQAKEASFYGASHYDVSEKEHWIEVIGSIFRDGETVDSELGRNLLKRLTKN
ncbi:hypothetical protein HR45_03105 [Shewanella mangrovi]|uniref:Uncharacterized protein n=1 Tax=Shewanella mangrovi TaxID=1515746 RepID=A0A094JEW4_9GAMM|nr:hypothetical protein [Shewanella mangrovi]KFZ38440.1 hypothetical protein HR45_03105 [Shewanella mangrovi]